MDEALVNATKATVERMNKDGMSEKKIAKATKIINITFNSTMFMCAAKATLDGTFENSKVTLSDLPKALHCLIKTIERVLATIVEVPLDLLAYLLFSIVFYYCYRYDRPTLDGFGVHAFTSLYFDMWGLVLLRPHKIKPKGCCKC